MQAGRRTEEPFFSGSQGCAERQQTQRKTEKPGERGSHPSARKKENPQVTVAQHFIHKGTKKTKTDFFLFTIFVLALTYGNIFVSPSLLLLDKIYGKKQYY